jgi:DNA-binding transcriptional LysR family regulator
MLYENLSAVDLNLLVALDALLAERNVSRAAARIGLSQPAMSRALSRIRDLLDDPVLVRAGREMVPTSRALAARAPLHQALDAVRRTLEPASEFEPAESSRSFSLSCIDTTQVILLPGLVDALSRTAPGVTLETRPLLVAGDIYRSLAAGELDLAIGRFDATPTGIRREPLYTDRIVCLVRQGHPRIRSRITLKQYLAEAHLAAEPVARADLPFTVEALLEKRGLQRRVAVKVSSFAVAPLIVSRTDLVCTAMERMIAPFRKGLGLRALAPPIDLGAIELQLCWHERVQQDPAHRWLRETILELFREGGAGASRS